MLWTEGIQAVKITVLSLSLFNFFLNNLLINRLGNLDEVVVPPAGTLIYFWRKSLTETVSVPLEDGNNQYMGGKEQLNGWVELEPKMKWQAAEPMAFLAFLVFVGMELLTEKNGTYDLSLQTLIPNKTPNLKNKFFVLLENGFVFLTSQISTNSIFRSRSPNSKQSLDRPLSHYKILRAVLEP